MPGGDRRPVSKRLFFKTNETLGLMAVTFRQLIRQVGQATTEAEAMRAVWREPRGAREAAAYQPNGRGVTYARERLDPYLDVPAVHQLAKTRHALVELLFAVRRFVITERGLPASLKALHPRYITQLPLDPYSGELFRYDPAQGLLYSVGRDALPAGGRGDLPPLTDLNEPTVKIGSRMAVEGR